MAALGLALRGDALFLVLLFLSLALIAHIWDLITRLRVLERLTRILKRVKRSKPPGSAAGPSG